MRRAGKDDRPEYGIRQDYGMGDAVAWGSEVGLLTVEQVQSILQRSRATIYRYANTDPHGHNINMPYDPNRLNPEHRPSYRYPLLFHPSEVARFAQTVLKVQQVKVEVLNQPYNQTQELLTAILEELKAIRTLLEKD